MRRTLYVASGDDGGDCMRAWIALREARIDAFPGIADWIARLLRRTSVRDWLARASRADSPAPEISRSDSASCLAMPAGSPLPEDPS